MKLFLISPQSDAGERVKALVGEKFPGHHIELDNRDSVSWVVAAPTNNTPASVAEQLKMTGKAGKESNAGLVIQIHDYFGYDSGALWQQMDVWANE